jgi:hypothetical protein
MKEESSEEGLCLVFECPLLYTVVTHHSFILFSDNVGRAYSCFVRSFCDGSL